MLAYAPNWKSLFLPGATPYKVESVVSFTIVHLGVAGETNMEKFFTG